MLVLFMKTQFEFETPNQPGFETWSPGPKAATLTIELNSIDWVVSTFKIYNLFIIIDKFEMTPHKRIYRSIVFLNDIFILPFIYSQNSIKVFSYATPEIKLHLKSFVKESLHCWKDHHHVQTVFNCNCKLTKQSKRVPNQRTIGLLGKLVYLNACV